MTKRYASTIGQPFSILLIYELAQPLGSSVNRRSGWVAEEKFCERGIHLLPEGWRTCVQAGDAFFE
ncbi:hypothetical protein KIN20_002340 [Parelaphostrongylus tenuis]|uniref:Uncharacterized protein n=1 Tax=Parelaphostrongylus tenuis TaxID=148309 RepID=A0AAD5LV17_PARTN|nr:hypothetical protein KIN20_002340 [Parelaphostrongylus tenuis]